MNTQRSLRVDRLLANLALALFLVSAALPQQALAQPTAELAAAQPGPPPAPQEQGTGPEATAPDCADSSRPPSAYHIKMLQENEIVVTQADDSSHLQASFLDYDSTSHGLVHFYNKVPGTDHEWGTSTTVDFNGSGRRMVLSVYRDTDEMLKASIVGRWGYPAQPNWRAGLGRQQGTNLKYIRVAAGNLERRMDGREAAVIAFRNDDGDLEMIALDGGTQADGGFGQADGSALATWAPSTVDGRGEVSHVAVATGDLDGDGFNDEIMTAFHDGNHHLQVLVTELNYRNSAWQWDLISSLRFVDETTSHGAWDVARDATQYGIAVVAGDANGDKIDEVVVGFSDRDFKLQAMVLDLKDGVLKDNFRYVRMDPDVGDYGDVPVFWGYPTYVSVATADYNADTRAEIVLAYTTDNNSPVVIRPVECGNTTCTLLVEKPFQWSEDWGYGAGRYGLASYVTSAAGDTDQDGYVDVAVGYKGAIYTDLYGTDIYAWVDLYKYDPASGGLVLATTWADDEGSTRNAADTNVVVGDLDGNSSRLTYTGVCKEYTKQLVSTVAHLPPTWLGVTLAPNLISVEFGDTSTYGQGDAHTSSTTYGGTLEIDESVSVLDIVETGPIFTYEAGKTHAETNEQNSQISMTKAHLSVFGADSSAGFAISDLTTYHSYQYTETPSGQTVWVRVPWTWASTPEVLEYYNVRSGREGWLPLGPSANLAQGKPATQSSTYYSWVASMAVDGNTDGDLNHNSVSHTWNDTCPWWQVDLGSSQTISAVRVWNRTDCCASRLEGWQIKVSDTGTDWATPKWASPLQGQLAVESTMVAVGQAARYVRIEIPNRAEYLSLAEVEVLGAASQIDRTTNLAQNKAASQSSTAGAAVAARAVDGNTSGALAGNSVATTNQAAGPWWEVDLGSVQPIGSVDVWNCTDADCKTRLRDWRVMVSKDGNWDSPDVWVYPRPEMDFDTIPEYPDPVTPIIVGQRGRYVRIEIPNRTESLNLAEVQVWKARQVSDFPKQVTRHDGQSFTITYQDGSTQKVNGNLQWDYCAGYLDPALPDIAGLGAISQMVGNSQETWTSADSTEQGTTFEDSYSLNETFAYEVKIMGMGVKSGISLGFEEGDSRSLTWGNGTYFSGKAGYVPSGFTSYDYTYCPYYYTVQQISPDGVEQSYLLFDYYVNWCRSAQCQPPPPSATQEVVDAERAVAAPAVTPALPVIASPTHPDPNTWTAQDDATFTWSQPGTDPATIAGYRWYLDQQPGTVPEGPGQGNKQATTYYKLPDGSWTFHLRAMSDDGQWSDTAHRPIRIDQNPPAVELALDPPQPTGNQGWYRTPVTVTVTATDAGSGIATLETSQDGATWQPSSGPLHLTADTPGVTVWARASDVAGHASEPVSATLKIDMTPPNSHVSPDCGTAGLCIAQIATDAQGNEYMELGGQLAEDSSGWAGMDIQVNGGSWSSASALGRWRPFPANPAVETHWYYTSTLNIPAGYHIFYGGASDAAGNHEEPYKIGELVWYPRAAPDLRGSTLAVEPATVRPGDVVTVTMTLRNGGLQEALVASDITLPPGLSPVDASLATLGGGITYDPGSNFILWPQRVLWPGTRVVMSFQARVAQGLGNTTLTPQMAARAFWPNTNLLPPDQQERFQDSETSTTATATLRVDPNLPAGRDVRAPHVRLAVVSGELARLGQVQLALDAGEDAAWMFLREWTLDPASGAWVVAKNSGWRVYSPTVDWLLSPGAGVKYLGVWVKDRAGNVSQLDESSMAFANQLAVREPLAAGQGDQYRFTMEPWDLAVFNAVADSGDPDLFAWEPRTGHYPWYLSMGLGLVDTIALRAQTDGVYLVEVAAHGDSAYTMLLANPATVAEVSAPEAVVKSWPDHPLAVSDPLSAGQAGTVGPLLPILYLPVMFRNN